MVVPWAHGFKSIKWLQRIVLTNDYQANDTYALQNNDPESPLKTAAYLDEMPARFAAGQPVTAGGLVISGLSGLQRVEYWLRAAEDGDLAEDNPAWEKAQRAWDRRPSVAVEIKPWLFRIARNACVDELRRRQLVQRRHRHLEGSSR